MHVWSRAARSLRAPLPLLHPLKQARLLASQSQHVHPPGAQQHGRSQTQPAPHSSQPPEAGEPRSSVAASEGIGLPSGSPSFYLIDLNPLLYRCISSKKYNVSPEEEAAATRLVGSSTQNKALTLLAKLISQGPSHFAVVVDVPDQETWRSMRYPAYKAHRPDPPPQLRQDMAAVLSVVEALAIPILTVPGVEADDVIATLATRAASQGMEVVIVSPDKDFFQLLGPRVKLMRLAHPEPKPEAMCTERDVEERFGFGAASWVDYLALCGDRSDNILGVKGIGEQTAAKLVREFGTLENILHDLEAAKLGPKQRAMLASAEGQAAAQLSKELVTLTRDLRAPPVRAPLEKFKLQLPPADGGSLALAELQRLQLPWVAQRLGLVPAAGWVGFAGAPRRQGSGAAPRQH